MTHEPDRPLHPSEDQAGATAAPAAHGGDTPTAPTTPGTPAWGAAPQPGGSPADGYGTGQGDTSRYDSGAWSAPAGAPGSPYTGAGSGYSGAGSGYGGGYGYGGEQGTQPYAPPAYGTATQQSYGQPGAPSVGQPDGSGYDWRTTSSYASPTPPVWSATPPPATGDGGSGGGRNRRTLLAAGVVAAVVGAGVGGGVAALVSNGSSTDGAVAVSTQAAPAAKVDGTVAAAAAAISPSVVTINVSASGGSGGGTGSGIVIKTDGGTGYILTNNHVVTLDSQTQASSNQITVTLPTGANADATVVGTDPSDDLAVVKVQANNLTAAAFAPSSKLSVGQTVVAMGAPLGLSNTVTSGIVSALARPVVTGSSQDASVFNAIQTDAAINPGNSGGPLVDLNGHVVGVNSAIAGTGSGSSDQQSGNIGIGFAIPSDEASRIASELISTGKATHAVLGITVNGSNQQSTGPTAGTGATVASVANGSPAESAGIKAGDVITKIGDQRIDDSTGAIAATRSFAPGTTVPVTVTSGGQSKTVSVKLGSATDS